MQQFDVIVIGGGVAGASLSLALSDCALNIALIDKRSLEPEALVPSCSFSPKVSALTQASVNLFKNIHVWPDVSAIRVCPYRCMKVWDAEGTGGVEFGSESAMSKVIGHIVENNILRNALLASLKKTRVSLYQSESNLNFYLDDSQGIVTLADETELQGKLLVAADGAESQLRAAANIPLSQKDYMHHAIVTTVETARYHQDTAWQVFLDDGPLAFLPLPSLNNKHYCSIVWSLVPKQAEKVIKLTNQEFCNQLERAFEQKLGKLICTESRFCFPLRERHAQKYYRNNVVLIGDAAHSIHPLAGQGMNLGLMDVAVLVEELKRAVKRSDNIAGSHILNRYQRRREGHNLTMMLAMRGFQKMFSSNNIAVRWLRNTGLKTVNQIPMLKEAIISQAMGITGDLPKLVRVS